MRPINAFMASLVLAASATLCAADAPASARGEDARPQAVRKVAAAPDVVVELSLESGDVVVRGWDRKEVEARSDSAARIELRQYESASAAEPAGKEGSPARRVEAFVLSDHDKEVHPGEFSGSGDIELSVPRGATVVLRVQSGDIEITDVAEARVESASGDIDISHVSKAVDVSALSGDITLVDARGGVRLRSLSGSVEATNVRPNDDKDFFNISSVSGEINLEDVTHAKVRGETVSGSVRFTGVLARGGGYDLRTTSGDVTMTIPADSSFKVKAKVVVGGEIISDFAVKSADATAPKGGTQGRLDGTVGAGEAEVTLTSFNGTVHLRKR